MTEKESLSFKWGTVKAWSELSENSLALLNKYFDGGRPMSAMAGRPDAERRAILCELIDQFGGKIWNDWDGVEMSKEEAKKYVTEYNA